MALAAQIPTANPSGAGRRTYHWPAALLPARPNPSFKPRLSRPPQDWRERVEFVAMVGFTAFNAATTE